VRDPRWEVKRKELMSLIEATIHRGNIGGEFDDPHPDVTALCLPGMMRSVMLFGPRGLDRDTVTAQITRLVERGVCGSGGRTKRRRDVAVVAGRNGG